MCKFRVQDVNSVRVLILCVLTCQLTRQLTHVAYDINRAVILANL